MPFEVALLLQVNPKHKFMGNMTKEIENHKKIIHRGHTKIHRDQASAERFNCTLAERLFGHQYAVEMLLSSGQ